jgi:hypothetical protein
VRIQRVVLEHHRDVALFGRNVVDHALADADLAGADFLEAGDHAQQRGLSAAGGTDQYHELAVGDGNVDAVHDPGVAEGFADLPKFDRRHRG